MKKVYDSTELVKILTEKGYNGYFKTQAAYPGKLKDSLGEFLAILGPDCRSDKNVLLETYLDWNGEDKRSIQCWISLENDHGKFSLDVMHISHNDRFGKCIEERQLRDMPLEQLPTKLEAIKIFSKKILSSSPKRGRRI